MVLNEVFAQVFINLWNGFLLALPGIVAAVITLFIGFIIGKLAGMVVREIIVRLKIDEWIAEEGVTFKFSSVFDVITRWIIYLVFIQQAAIFLNVQAITIFVNNVISIIPPLIQAGLLVIVGYSLAIYMKERIISSKTLYADVVGKTVFFLILYLSIAMALSQMRIDTTLVNNILLLIVAGASLGVAIALGLGLKDVVAVSAKDYARKFKKGRRRR
ncbi:MAG: hypothetical protein ACE5J7_01360 [Candidatus Aenigmatarchaeota archaeon]